MSTQVTIIDYGLGNLHSLQKALEHLGAKVQIDECGERIDDSEKIIIPGVGAYPKGMQGLESRDQIAPIRKFASSGRPVMGICLGCQLLLDGSMEFNDTKGLGLIPGIVEYLPQASTTVPHIGWNKLEMNPNGESNAANIFSTFKDGVWTYFVHSYHCLPTNDSHRLATCHHGDAVLTAAIGQNNIFGFQFHPEKSSADGLKILEDFLEM
jgi:imidazole glycerol-phosphate synthase subunit HisH